MTTYKRNQDIKSIYLFIYLFMRQNVTYNIHGQFTMQQAGHLILNSFILFGLNHFQWRDFVYIVYFVYAWFSGMFV